MLADRHMPKTVDECQTQPTSLCLDTLYFSCDSITAHIKEENERDFPDLKACDGNNRDLTLNTNFSSFLFSF
ncbi:CLUMA_CG004948, isoform A [Clunio marinus]|uniref:CLUMA_CG004948, isoform A n=1 Tax=Clunio marinus TaxID=568069 RepID=A0A1J1HTE6_9DIPT|nr:CLUMA_CG004948, isoform A [Clunio marinus]